MNIRERERERERESDTVSLVFWVLCHSWIYKHNPILRSLVITDVRRPECGYLEALYTFIHVHMI